MTVAAAFLVALCVLADSPSCGGCHQPEYERWQGSDHARAMAVARPAAVLGDFGGATFTAGGMTSTFSRRGGKFFARTEGPDGELTDYEIAYTFGARPLQQYLVRFPGGRMQALGVAWDARPKASGGQRWFHLYPNERIAPDDPLHWTGPAQNWNSMCAGCHSTNLRKNYRPDENRYDTEWSEIDVACEACHGPGERHVAWARARTEGGARQAGENGLLVPLETAPPSVWVMQPESGIATRREPLATRVEVETCAPCHSRRRSLTDSHTAGAPLLAGYRPALLDAGLYYADGQIQDEVYEYGSFLQSRMYRAGVTCSDCHDPHGLAPRARGNALCARCHLPARFDVPSHHRHPAGSPGAECVACHMPARTYMVVDPRRDHGMRVPRPDLTVAIGTPNACNGCHADRPATWAAEVVAEWTAPKAPRPHFALAIHAGREVLAGAEKRLAEVAADPGEPGIARATAIELLAGYPSPPSAAVIAEAARDGDPLVRLAAAGAETLPPEIRARALAPLLDDPLLAVREAAAVSLASVPREFLSPPQESGLDRALAEVRASEAFNADRPDAHVNLGLLELRLGRPDRAREHYERALEVGPYFLPAYVNLADLDRSEGREAEGEELLRSALRRDPSNADLHHALGLLLVRRGRKKEAIEELRLAASGSSDPRHAYVYGVALNDAGRPDRALEVLATSHRAHTGHRETLLALATISRDRGRLDAALGYAESLVALTPGDPGTLALLQEIEAARGARQKLDR